MQKSGLISFANILSLNQDAEPCWAAAACMLHHLFILSRQDPGKRCKTAFVGAEAIRLCGPAHLPKAMPRQKCLLRPLSDLAAVLLPSDIAFMTPHRLKEG